MKVTTHLRNQVTAAIGHAVSRGDWTHQIADEVFRAIDEHEECTHCAGPAHEHDWKPRQNITTKGYRLPPYDVCECGTARPVTTT